MAWIKLDDQWMNHPKIIRAGRDARDMWLASLTWCSSYLTDGYFTEDMLITFAVMAGVDVANVKQIASKLLEVCLWDATDGGFKIHDYEDYNFTKEQVIAVREARREAGRAGGEAKSGKNKQNASKMLANGKQNSGKSLPHTPSPSPLKDTTTTAEPSAEEKPEDLPDDPLEPSEEFAEMCRIYENIGGLSPKISDELQDILDEYGVQWFDAAVKEAVLNNKRNLKYIMAILERWKVEGFQSPMKKPTPAGRPGGTRYPRQQQQPDQSDPFKGYLPA
ncbi:MAG: DnaD domain protein [Syntrophobacteraceae bacterium]